MHRGARWWRRTWLATAVLGLALTGLGTFGSASAQPATAQLASSTWPAWRQQALPGTGPGVKLTSVSCPSTTFCLAVGDDYVDHTVVSEAWNGTRWRPVPMANPTGPSPSYFFSIGGVSCTSRTACVAVGNVEGRIDLHTLAEVWNGTRWRTTAPVFAGNEPSLGAVSCANAEDCIAVGRYVEPGTAAGRALAEKWDGTAWRRILHSGTTGSLTQVSCPTASLCFAGGEYASGLERWNGTAWRLVQHDTLTAKLLSCASRSSCLALGCPNPSTCLRLGIQNSYAWNGSAWRQVTFNGAKRQNLLQSLSCVSATSCTAVGGLRGDPTAVAGRWNGHYWVLQRDPGGVPGLSLGTVSCVTGACEALGLVPVPHDYGEPAAVGSA